MRASTRPILPSADLAATAAFYAPLGFVQAGRWPQEYLILAGPHHIELHFWCNPKVRRRSNDVACWVGFERAADVRRLHSRWSAADVRPPAGSTRRLRRDTSSSSS
ncbi:MAG TPA: hypothetical protein VER39_06710 [Nocardioidaceae bacterium]|nr:hypothetical protein [Nocardioidaceae bacterium]